MISKVALIFAMEAEARPLIDELALEYDPSFGDPRLPFKHFRGQLDGRMELMLSLSGKHDIHQVDNIGTEPATLNAYVTLSRFQPDLCINAGTAGGFRSRGCEIGDVFLIDKPCKFHDHRIPIPGFDAYGIGSYPVFAPSGMAEALGLKKGGVSTGNALDHTDVCLKLIEQNEGNVKEMEAAAIAWIASMMKVPFMALKSVTDIVDGEHPTEEEFLRNLDAASRRIREKTLEVLKYISSHPQLLRH
ncbi:MAG: 5'-methylthioadenosine nucleosidase [Bdellovibrionia bacterium]